MRVSPKIFLVSNRALGEQDLVFALKNNHAGNSIYELNPSHDLSCSGPNICDGFTRRGYDLNPKAKIGPRNALSYLGPQT